MDNEYASLILQIRCDEWNAKILQNRVLDNAAHYSWRDLRKSSLVGMDFTDRNLCGIRLAGSSITDCKFKDANLRGADFSRCTIRNCDFRGALLLGVDFSKASISHSRFIASKRAFCNFAGCSISSRSGLWIAKILELSDHLQSKIHK
jgi:uncharacterized protein YjbI with pentapeptide repeats